MAAWPFGGHLPDFDEQCRELVKAGVEVHVVCTRDQSDRWTDPAAGPRVHTVPLDRSPTRPWALGAAAAIRAIRPDLVHVYGFRGAVLLPLVDRRPRWIYDLRTGSIAPPLRAAVSNWLSRCESIPYDWRVTIHEALARRVWGRVAGRGVTVIPLGADFDRFQPVPPAAPERLAVRRRFGLAPDDVVIVYLGSLNHTRNPQRLLDVAARLADVPRLRWLIAGHGSALPALEARLRDAPIRAVRLIGPVDYASTHSVYGAADVGFAYVPMIPAYDCQPPLKTIEMLAAGLPVVATATQGNRMFVEDGQNGSLALDSVDELASALGRVVGDLTACRQRVLADRPRLEQYSWCRIVQDRLIPLYEQVLLRGRSRSSAAA